MKSFNLPHGIQVFVKSTPDGPSGTITSGLRVLEMDEEDVAFNTGIDAIESLILAHACAGIAIESYEYRKGVETTISYLLNNL
jgi:hypothetical protein